MIIQIKNKDFNTLYIQRIDIYINLAYNIYQRRIIMSETTNVCIRIDANLKKQADLLFDELGMNMSTAFNIFVRQAIRDGGIPFSISLNRPNSTTLKAMKEAEKISKDQSIKSYNNLDELFENLGDD